MRAEMDALAKGEHSDPHHSLANSRDKKSQIIWGIKDFEYRFGRKPEGLWLPETAVGLETLDLMAQHGIGFAPRQASRVRPIDGDKWQDVNGGEIYPAIAYRVSLPSGAHLPRKQPTANG